MEMVMWIAGGIISAIAVLWLLRIVLALGIVYFSIRKMADILEESDRDVGVEVKDKAYYRKQARAELREGWKESFSK